MRYESLLKNVKFICNNLNYLETDSIYEFNSIINYFVDKVIQEKFDKKIKS